MGQTWPELDQFSRQRKLGLGWSGSRFGGNAVWRKHINWVWPGPNVGNFGALCGGKLWTGPILKNFAKNTRNWAASTNHAGCCCIRESCARACFKPISLFSSLPSFILSCSKRPVCWHKCTMDASKSTWQTDSSNVLIQECRASANRWWFMMLDVCGDSVMRDRTVEVIPKYARRSETSREKEMQWCFSFWPGHKSHKSHKSPSWKLDDWMMRMAICSVFGFEDPVLLQTSPESEWLKKRNRVQVCSLWW